jgi:hypothetical protein
MAQSNAEWVAVRTDGEVEEFGSAKDLFDALLGRPGEFEPDSQIAQPIAAATAAAPRSTGIDGAGNRTIVFAPGCTDIAVGSVLAAVEVTSLVILSQQPCNAFAPPFLPLWPTAPGVATMRDVPGPWQATARSALTWY